MKRTVLAIAVIVAAAVSSIYAQAFDREIAQSVEAFSRAYIKAHPEIGMRAGLAILELEELSDLARQNKIGVAVETRLAEGLDTSLAFILVDRKNMEKLLGEMEFSLSGLVDGSTALKIGEMTGARAFISGSITEERDAFRVSLSLTDGQDGVVLSTRAFALPRTELIKAAVDLQYQYVSKHGMGLTIAPLVPIFGYDSSLFTKGVPAFVDVAMLYRPSRFIQIGAGILYAPMNTGELYRSEAQQQLAVIQPQLPAPAEGDSWGYFPNSRFSISQETARFDILLFHADAQFTLNVFPWLNVGFSGGVVGATANPVMLVARGSADNAIYYRQLLAIPATAGTPTASDYYSMPVLDEQEFRYLFQPAPYPGFRVELRPEVFITPRVAVYAKLAYQWLPPFQVREVHAAHGDWYFYQEGKDPSSWVYDSDYDPFAIVTTGSEDPYKQENRNSWIYYGLNPLLKADGSRYVLDLSAFYAQLGISFYF